MMTIRFNTFYFLALFILTCACTDSADSNEDDTSTQESSIIQLSGTIDKGPFLIGSTVHIIPVGHDGASSSMLYATQTINDLGEFGLSMDYEGYIQLECRGFYYNEYLGTLSGANVTLRAFHNVTSQSAQVVHINTFTHLTFNRIGKLIRGGVPYYDAVLQAETELRGALAISPASFIPRKQGILMGLSSGDDDGNAYLLALSAIVAKIGGNDSGIQEFLNLAAADLEEDGLLNADKVEQLHTAMLALDTKAVMDMLANRYNDLGSTAIVPNIDRVLDQDEDGQVNFDDCLPFDPSRQTGNADVDGDGSEHSACGGDDCDDNNPNMNPGMIENIIDGMDNNCDGVVCDDSSQLCWQYSRGEDRSVKPLNEFTPYEFPWSKADAYCDNLVINGYGNWRLPSVADYATILQNCVSDGFDYSDCSSCENSTVCNGLFGDNANIAGRIYWTSVVNDGHYSSDEHKQVTLSTGNVTSDMDSFPNSVRCVRTSTEPPISANCHPGAWHSDGGPSNICTPWTECVIGEYVETAGSATSDRQCAPCSPGKFTDTANSTSCTPWTQCQDNQFELHSGTLSFDRTCLTCPDNAPCDSVLTNIVAGGVSNTCGLLPNGEAICWGGNSFNVSIPPKGVTFSMLAAGYQHVCGIRTSDGQVECWGSDHTGQLQAPARVFVALSASSRQTCGITQDSIWCWGELTVGNHGGSREEYAGGFVGVAVGNHHRCGIRASDGEVECWGDNDHGQSSPPANIAFNMLVAGDNYTCGIRSSDDEAQCWGANGVGYSAPPENVAFTSLASNSFGKICGIRASDSNLECWDYYDSEYTSSNSSPPEGVAFDAVIVGGYHTCGVHSSNGDLNCWGRNAYGQLISPLDSTYTKFSSSKQDIHCGIRASDSKIECWGNIDGAASVGTTFAEVCSGARHACGTKSSNGQVECWGSNKDEQLSVPLDISFSKLACGSDHTCGIRVSDSNAQCWGDDTNGQLTPPVGVAFDFIAANDDQTCGIRLSDNEVECWGTNAEGESPPNIGTPFIKLCAALSTCGVRLSDGKIECWGGENESLADNFNQLYPNASFSDVAMTRPFWDLGMDAKPSQICGIRKDSEDLVCYKPDGPVILPPPEVTYVNPNIPPAGVKFTSLSATDDSICGIRKEDKRLVCWGEIARNMWK